MYFETSAEPISPTAVESTVTNRSRLTTRSVAMLPSLIVIAETQHKYTGECLQKVRINNNCFCDIFETISRNVLTLFI